MTDEERATVEDLIDQLEKKDITIGIKSAQIDDLKDDLETLKRGARQLSAQLKAMMGVSDE